MWAWWELRIDDPLVDLRVIVRPPVLLTNAASSAMTVSGLRRGGPPSSRGTATCSSTAGSIDESAACPA
ncbi:hypothetical protein ACFZC5_33635 [Nocardia gamkensis]|uniref:hypothetical protein n=1 Tax=Nocardia gamkensis TaxID=352869 RepID=UPI0036EF29F7